MNTLVETSWGAQCAQEGYLFGRWLQKTTRLLRRIIVPEGRNCGCWWAFACAPYQTLQQRKPINGQVTRDFFFTNHIRRYRRIIPGKTWKRHSALLVYTQVMFERQVQQTGQCGLPVNAKIVENATENKRISCEVLSIRHLPVWAVGMLGLGLLTNELSSLSVMELYATGVRTAQAA